jgi:hypothetical protein
MAAREDTIAGSFSVVVVSFYKEPLLVAVHIYVRDSGDAHAVAAGMVRADRRKADEFCGGDLLDGFSHARQN